LRGYCEGYRLHRGPGHYRQDFGPFSRKGTRSPYPIAPAATLPSTPWTITSFCRKRIHSPKSARTLLRNAWHGRLHAIVQEWTDMHCAITSANNFSGESVVISRISPVQLAGSVRKPTLNRPFMCPILCTAV